MRRGWRWWWLGGLLVLGIVAALGGGGGVAAGSTLTRGSSGWLGLRATLESLNVASVLRDRPLDDNGSKRTANQEPSEEPSEEIATLVLAFPLQRALQPSEIDAIMTRLHAGGTVVVAYGGQPIDLRERRFLEVLGLTRSDPTPRTLVPWKWPAAQRATWTLLPVARELSVLRSVEVAAPRAWPIAPDSANVLYRGGPDDVVAVFAMPVHRGWVVMLPSDAWSNARLGQPGNADLLATLAADLSTPWEFDEFHHGLTDRALAAARRASAVVVDFGWVRLTYWDVLTFHLALLYGLGLVALGRRFGAVWREEVVASGSTGAFLRGLGTLHDRLGHHGDVARRLAQRLSDRQLGWDPEARAAAVTDGPSLIAFGRDIHTELSVGSTISPPRFEEQQ